MVFGAADNRYEIVTCTVNGRSVQSHSDFSIGVVHDARVLARADTLIIPPFGDARLTRELPEPVAAALDLVRPGTRIVSICTGAFVLGAAGLLDGRPATTHWALAGTFRKWFPRVDLDPNVLFVDDGDILTSAGASSGVDVCIHIVRRDHGSDLANHVARRCVVPPWRDGGQAQFIEHPVPELGSLGTAVARQWALEHLDQPQSLSDLARHASMSRRTFARRFGDEVGMSPGRWLTQQRVHRARQLLETTDMSVDAIAARVGFATAASLRQHLHAAIGVSPLVYRRTFHTAGRLS